MGAAAVASPASAEGFELKIGGFMEQWLGYTDSSNTTKPQSDVWAQHSDVEIHFSAKQTLDNGLTIGFLVELEGESSTSSGDEVDEQYMTVEGSFGKIIMGSENTAPYLMHYNAKNNGIGMEEGDGASVWGPGTSGALANSNQHVSVHNDNNSVTFISPRVNGIQVGASYVPSAASPDSLVPASGGTESDGTRDNGFGVAANYETSISDMSVKASLEYTDAGSDSKSTANGDQTALGGALQLGFGGFTASFAYGEHNKDNATAADVNVFVTGLAYNAGPAGVSIVYARGEDTDLNDKQDFVELGANYAVGPGVTAKGSIYAWERKSGGSDVADGVAIAGGLVLSF
jgi:predicted porin